MWLAESEFCAVLDSFLKTDKHVIAILTLINLVKGRQLKMSWEMNSMFPEMEKGEEVS